MSAPPGFVRGERGSALLLAMIVVMLLAAAGAAAILAAQSEVLIAASFRQAREAAYVAEGAVSRALDDLAANPDWTTVLSGTVVSTFIDGSATGSKPLPSGGTAVLCCGASSLTGDLQVRGNGGADWGADTPQWQIFGWGPASAWLPAGGVRSVFYTAVWVADDPADGDGAPSADSNDTLVIMGLAIGPSGARRGVRAIVHRLPAAGTAPVRIQVLSWTESRW